MRSFREKSDREPIRDTLMNEANGVGARASYRVPTRTAASARPGRKTREVADRPHCWDGKPATVMGDQGS